jgi:serine/threonine protein kinase
MQNRLQDLSGANVLLTSTNITEEEDGDRRDSKPCGAFCAKISDFGMSRSLGTTSRIDTHSVGTITHVAPELLTQTSSLCRVRDSCLMDTPTVRTWRRKRRK